MCTDLFLCTDEVHILTYELKGSGFFIVMLIVALGLQITANYIWIQSAQVSREILQKDPDERGNPFDPHTLMGRSLMWTLISTVIFIIRITLIMGSNLYIFLVVLTGNLIGTYYTQLSQKRDHVQYLADDIFQMIRMKNTCNQKIKTKIQKALSELKTELDNIDLRAASSPDNPNPADLRF